MTEETYHFGTEVDVFKAELYAIETTSENAGKIHEATPGY